MEFLNSPTMRFALEYSVAPIALLVWIFQIRKFSLNSVLYPRERFFVLRMLVTLAGVFALLTYLRRNLDLAWVLLSLPVFAILLLLLFVYWFCEQTEIHEQESRTE